MIEFAQICTALKKAAPEYEWQVIDRGDEWEVAADLVLALDSVWQVHKRYVKGSGTSIDEIVAEFRKQYREDVSP